MELKNEPETFKPDTGAGFPIHFRRWQAVNQHIALRRRIEQPDPDGPVMTEKLPVSNDTLTSATSVTGLIPGRTRVSPTACSTVVMPRPG